MSEHTSEHEQLIPVQDIQSKALPTLKFSAAIFNCVNTIIGSGFLTLPYNFKLDGYANGLFLLFFMAISAALSACVLVDVSNVTHCYTYKEISAKLFGSENWGILIAIITIIYTFGSLTSYATIIQDNFFFFDEDDFVDKQLLFWPIMLLLIFPLSCFQKLDFLHFCSYVTISVVVYIAVVSIVYYFSPDKVIPEPPTAFKWTSTGLSTVPLFQSAFAFHYQVGNVYRDLQDKSHNNMQFAIVLNVLIVLSLYLVVAVFGYFEFTDFLHSDLLKAFSYVVGDVWYVKTANVLMLFAMVAHYPLPAFGMRRMIESLFWGDNDAPKKWRIIIALCIIVVCSLCGSFISEISTILGFTSSISGSCVVFFFPGIFEYFVWKKVGGTARLILSIYFMLLGIYIFCSGLTMQFIMVC